MIMYGDQWDQAAVCFQWLALCVWAQMLSSVCGAVFLGLQRTDQTFKCGVINFFLIIIAIGAGVVNDSLMILSLAVAIIYNVIFVITYVMLIAKTMHRGVGLMVRTVGLDFVAMLVFMVGSYFFPLPIDNVWLSLLAKCGITLLYYVVYLALTRQFKVFLRLAASMLPAMKKKARSKAATSSGEELS